MKSVRFISLIFCLVAISLTERTSVAQSNPVPFVNQPLVPGAVVPASPQFSLTVHGAGFVHGSIVNWNGTHLATTFVSAAKLTAVVPASNVSKAGTANITVVSPTPGGGSSNSVPFIIAEPSTDPQFTASAVPGTISPINLVTADFNHDGIADLAIVDQGPAPACNYQYSSGGSIAILLGNGDGTFTRHSTLCYPDYRGITPLQLAVAGDVNRDGNLDLIGAYYFQTDDSYSNLTFYGVGDGTFSLTNANKAAAAAPAVSSTSAPYFLALGDFESSGQLDIAVSETDDFDGFHYLSITPPSGSGGVTLIDSPLTTSGPLSVGDFNGDGVLDFADESDSSVEIFLSNGNWKFTQLPAVPFGTGTAMVSGDFNGDGILDLATANGNTISVLLGKGDGTFVAKGPQPTSAQTNVDLITADFNGDGKLDLATIDSTNAVSILLGKGDGTFQAPVDTTGTGDGIVAADFNGDGRMDLAITNSDLATVTVLLQPTPTCGDPSQNAPFSGTYNVPPTTLPLVITWNNPTAGCVVRYTTDGSTPTATSPAYPSGGLPIYSTTAIRVIATATGFKSSAIVGGKWTLNLPTCGTPSQNAPYSGTYTAPPTKLPLLITWTNPTAACVLHYTTDGSTPTATSPTYPAHGLSISTTTAIRVLGAATGYNPSAVAGGKWTIN